LQLVLRICIFIIIDTIEEDKLRFKKGFMLCVFAGGKGNEILLQRSGHDFAKRDI
jgi:hypothetical protein